MESNLRPLTLGEILDRTAQLYRTHFLLFAGIFSLWSGVALVFNLSQLGLLQLLKATHRTGTLGWLTITLSLAESVIVLLLMGASMAAISRAVASVYLGDPITIRGSYASIRPRLGRYLWLMTITFVRAWLPAILLYAGFLAVVLRYKSGLAPAGRIPDPAQQQALMTLGIAGVVFFLLMIPVGVYTTWMSLRYSLSVPACVVENLKAPAAIRRSIELSKGARWRVFVLLILVAVIKYGLVLLTQAFVVVAAFKHPGQIAPGISALSSVISFLTNSFLGPIGATGLTLFYYDQRVRKEGYDIEWMMAAAGLTTGAASPESPDTAPAVSAAASIAPGPTMELARDAGGSGESA